MPRTQPPTHDYYVIETETQRPLGVYEASTPYLATIRAADEWSLPSDQLSSQEMPASPTH